jgi:SAM-dependent methyltransferase
MTDAEVQPDPLVVRRRLSSHLSGEGIEIGPGHVPFPVPADAKVRYIDRWQPTENSELFPELGDAPGFPRPDVVANLDVERLGVFADRSQDFVIASHILEHLANPLAMLVEAHRVLKPLGLCILLLPDRHQTFDRYRDPTPLAHVIEEYQRDVHEVDDAHVLDYIAGYEKSGDTRDRSVVASQGMAAELERQRRRSVHAHVWDRLEFTEVLDYASTELGVAFDVVDAFETGDPGTYGDEFGWLLRRGEPES